MLAFQVRLGGAEHWFAAVVVFDVLGESHQVMGRHRNLGPAFRHEVDLGAIALAVAPVLGSPGQAMTAATAAHRANVLGFLGGGVAVEAIIVGADLFASRPPVVQRGALFVGLPGLRHLVHVDHVLVVGASAFKFMERRQLGLVVGADDQNREVTHSLIPFIIRSSASAHARASEPQSWKWSQPQPIMPPRVNTPR